MLQPDAVDALLNRAAALRDSGEYSLALDDIAEVLRHKPADAQALCLRGLIEITRRTR